MSDSTSTNSSGPLKVQVVTPEATILETSADFVALPLFDGELGVGPLHSPMIGRLGYGELRIRSGEEIQRFFVDGGFVQVADNNVAVLTNRAVAAEKIDSAEAAEQLQTALQQRASGLDELAIRDRNLSQARGQLRVAQRGK